MLLISSWWPYASWLKRVTFVHQCAWKEEEYRILDRDTIEHLLQQQNLTFDTAITMCRGEEATKKQRSDIMTLSLHFGTRRN